MKITIAFVAVMVLSFTGYNVYKTQKAIQLPSKSNFFHRLTFYF